MSELFDTEAFKEIRPSALIEISHVVMPTVLPCYDGVGCSDFKNVPSFKFTPEGHSRLVLFSY